MIAEYCKLSQVIAWITDILLYVLSLLEQINMASSTWHAATENKNTLTFLSEKRIRNKLHSQEKDKNICARWVFQEADFEI